MENVQRGDLDEELQMVCASSEAGKRCLAKPLEQLDMNEISARIVACVGEPKEKGLIAAAVHQNREHFSQQTKSRGIGPSATSAKNHVNFEYVGLKSHVVIFFVMFVMGEYQSLLEFAALW